MGLFIRGLHSDDPASTLTFLFRKNFVLTDKKRQIGIEYLASAHPLLIIIVALLALAHVCHVLRRGAISSVKLLIN